MVYIFLFNESIYCQQTTKRGGRGFFKRKISLDQTKQNQERMKQTRKGKYVTKLKEIWTIKNNIWGFPGGAVVENLPADAGDTGSSPGLGRSHMPRSN